MEENPIQIEIEDNTTFKERTEGYKNLRYLFDASPEFEQILTKSSLEDLNKFSKIIIYPPYAAALGGENPEKDDQFIIKCIKDKDKSGYKSGNLVGFIGYGKERLTIKSRFGNTLFLYLLEKVLQIQIAKNFKADANSLDSLDILCLLFPFYLKSAMTRGPYKEYIERPYNDSNLRGKLDISRFIKEDIPFMGKVPYFCREFSFDNGITELICCTIDYIERHKRLSALLSEVQEEIRKIKTAAFSYKSQNKEKIIEWNKRHSIKNGFYSAYRPLQTLCLDILQNHKSSLGTGPDRIYGVLFDCAWLWEEYVNLLIGEEFYHPKNKEHKGTQHMLYATDEKTEKVSRIYPDFIRRQSPRTIADAKYKPVENIDSKDRLRMIGYLWRFDSMPGYFIFPEKEGDAKKDELKWFKSDGFESKDFEDAKEKSREEKGGLAMVACGVKIPQEAENYGVFSAVMEKEEEKFKKEFLNRIANHGKG